MNNYLNKEKCQTIPDEEFDKPIENTNVYQNKMKSYDGGPTDNEFYRIIDIFIKSEIAKLMDEYRNHPCVNNTTMTREKVLGLINSMLTLKNGISEGKSFTEKDVVEIAKHLQEGELYYETDSI